MARLSRTASPPERRFDLVVVGSGITGACVAFEAVRRGLATLLVEAGDFGGGTSWSSLRILHGGLRYLQSADLVRFRASVRDRRWFQRAFPDLTVPQPVLLPLRGEGLRRPSVMRAALGLNDLLAAGRNAGVAAPARLASGSLLGREATLAAVPLAEGDDVKGGALWWDARAHPPQRIVMEILLRAVAGGAEVWSRAPVRGIGRAGDGLEVELGRVDGGGLPGSLLADRVAVCVGPERPAIEGVVAEVPGGAPPAGLAFNVVLRKTLPGGYGVAVDPPDGSPAVFAYPLGDLTLAGTAHEAGSEREVQPPSEAAVGGFLERLSSALGSWSVGPDDVARVLWGALPCTAPGSAQQAARPSLLPVRGLGGRALVVVAVKYTTAPGLARQVLDRLAPSSKAVADPGPRPVRAVPDGRGFLELTAGDAPAAADLVRALAAEGAESVEDVVLRRTDWGLDPAVGAEIAERIQRLGAMP